MFHTSVVKLGDGWSSAMLPAKQLVELVQRLKGYLAEEGRATDPFEIQGVVTNVADADGFRRVEAAGLTDLITMPWALYGHGLGGAPLDRKVDGMKRFADEVMARMS